MNNRVTFAYDNALHFVGEEELLLAEQQVLAARDTLLNRNGAGNDFLGWIDLPVDYDKEEYARIKEAAKRISSDSDVLVVVGIGGSYLGARAAIEFTHHAFFNQLTKEERKHPEIYFCGNSVSASYLADLLDLIGERDFSVNMISKSGTTTEPGIAFRVLKELLVKRYGKDGAAKRIYATTDRAKGALKQEADEMHYETFVVPDDVGGRFSVLTAVGLLPIAVSGMDLDALMKGAAEMREYTLNTPYAENDVLRYAALRHILYQKGKEIEVLVNYEPSLHSFSEWWKQLFGESQGKDGKGLYPASVDFTTDLHSMGQYLQDGRRILFETILKVEKSRRPLAVPSAENDADGLSYLAGRDFSEVNEKAMLGTMKAHVEGGVPCLVVSLPAQDEETLGQLISFFEFACGVSGYLLGVNPFDQPGVEFYKKNMFALLGKPGY